MKTSAQYREFAADCLRLAEESIVADMPGKQVSVRETTGRDSQRQIGAGRCRLPCAH
jgi:hypothetical protein